MTKEQKLQNLANSAKYVFSLIAQRDRLNSSIDSLKADIEKAGYEIGEDENGKFLARKLRSEIKHPLWDWNSFEYRVKPVTKKVAIDKNLNRHFISEQLSNIRELIDTEIFIYEGEYISVDDVLWYWEYQDADDHWEKSDYRATRAEIEKLSNFHNFAPLYGLGFRIKEGR